MPEIYYNEKQLLSQHDDVLEFTSNEIYDISGHLNFKKILRMAIRWNHQRWTFDI